MLSVWLSVAAFFLWLALAALVYVYLIYPLLLAFIAVSVSNEQAPLGFVPTISVLIAAYNEEAGMRNKIEQTLALEYPAEKIEVLVLSDASTDRTDAIVGSIADSRVKLIRSPQRSGKTSGQNRGAEAATGDILIFSDATTVYHPLALKYLACNYADETVGCVSGRYQYFDPQGDSPTGSGMIAFWNYENLIKTMQSRIRTITGCCGCIYSVRRSAYTVLDPDIISDLVQPLWAIRKGYRVVFEDRALAYEETTKSSKQEFLMRVRVVTRGIRGVLSVPSLFNPIRYGWVSFQLLSHKLLRWLVPIYLVVLLLSNSILWNRPGYGWLMGMQLAFYGFAILTLLVPLHRIWRPLGIPLFFCTLNAAALRSLLEVARGRKYVIWETIRS